MKAIMVLYDTLCWRMLPAYGNDWVVAPNFERLAERTVTFDKSYIGSFPTMPCRRELHTGRYNFLHRAWGPLEPFDDSMPQILTSHRIHTHLVTDTYHYLRDGGFTYLGRYATREYFRGQEGDEWVGVAGDEDDEVAARLRELYREDLEQMPKLVRMMRRHELNKRRMPREEDFSQTQVFARGIEFIDTNRGNDNWFLQIETFDPHQPWYVPQRYRDLYPTDYAGPNIDWPPRTTTQRPPEEVEHIRCQYAALVSMCDANLGKVLDKMDEHDLWRDTMLIVGTDHGFLLGEHGMWNKQWPWLYDEIARTPLFIWDPRNGKQGERRQSLVQAIDWAPSLLDYFGVDIPPDMQGKPLRDTLASDAAVHEAALMGCHGRTVQCTDGRYMYVRDVATPRSAGSVPAESGHPTAPPHGQAARAPGEPCLFNYTLMPTAMANLFPPAQLRKMELAEPFSFTKGCRTMRIPAGSTANAHDPRHMLFDLAEDPDQEHPIQDAAVEATMVDHMVRLMRESDAPPEQFRRMGLPV